MKSILLATDFSDRADRAAKRATALARAHGASLNVLHVVDKALPRRVFDAQEPASRAQLEDISDHAASQGVKCSVLLEHSEAHEAICEAALATASDLVIVGSHRRDAMRNASIGTTAERMLLMGTTPLLIVRTDDTQDYSRPVIAVNLEDEGISHILRVQELGIVPNESIVAVFGYEAGQFQIMRRAGATLAELNEVFEEELKTVQPTVNRFMGDAGLDPAQAVVKPILYNTPDTVLSAARESKADLLVVGSRRKTAFKRYTLGSVSEACILRAETDLLILPPTD